MLLLLLARFPFPIPDQPSKMLARSSLLTARSALRQAPANPAMRRGLHVDSKSSLL